MRVYVCWDPELGRPLARAVISPQEAVRRNRESAGWGLSTRWREVARS